MKTKTIPFDLETAKKIQAGEIEGKIMMRCGDEVRIVCWNSTAKFCGFTQPIIAQAQDQDEDADLYAYFGNGRYIGEEEHPKDLFLEVIVNERQLKPFDRVLVRDSEDQSWRCSIFSHCRKIKEDYSYYAGGIGWNMCIPYEGNEHLVGTTDNHKEQ